MEGFIGDWSEVERACESNPELLADAVRNNPSQNWPLLDRLREIHAKQCQARGSLASADTKSDTPTQTTPHEDET